MLYNNFANQILLQVINNFRTLNSPYLQPEPYLFDEQKGKPNYIALKIEFDKFIDKLFLEYPAEYRIKYDLFIFEDSWSYTEIEELDV